MTARGYTNGYEYYGTFSRALYTLFQVMTGESWSEAIARPLIFGLEKNAFLPAAFFVSFIILTQIVLVNVVVAVLLDKFASGPEDEPEEKINLAELVKRMDDKEAVTLYIEQKEKVAAVGALALSAPGSPIKADPKLASAQGALTVDDNTSTPTVKIPPSIAKLPTDKGDIDQVLQLLVRLDARMSAIERQHTGSQQLGNSVADEKVSTSAPAVAPSRLPPPPSPPGTSHQC